MGVAMLQMQESLAATQLSLLQLAQGIFEVILFILSCERLLIIFTLVSDDLAEQQLEETARVVQSLPVVPGVASEAKSHASEEEVRGSLAAEVATPPAREAAAASPNILSIGSPAVASAERKPATESPIRELRSKFFSKLTSSAPPKDGDGDAAAAGDQK
jgi:hypothetical protein